MFVAAISAMGFRNLGGRISLSQDLAILVGENNSGKSNVVDAIRILFEAEAGPHARQWVGEQDFQHDGRGNRLTETLELAAELEDLTQKDKARMVTCLAPSLGPDVARLRIKARLRTDGRVDVEWFGGDSQHADVERWAREAVTYTYLPPLRDAAGDLRPGRDNRLVALVKMLAPEGHGDRNDVERIVAEANAALGEIPALREAKSGIQDRLVSMTGSVFGQQTDLVFADPRFERVVGTLRAMAGRLEPLELRENGLGYNNLIYMAVLLAGLSQPRTDGLRLLLVEEPEAHLHPQLQDLLMRYLESESGANTQVIVTSHSPNLASAARVERVTVMIPPTTGVATLARTPADFGIGEKELAYLRRFLDVTKAALLFARAVILVEGIAEQLLLPSLARRMERSLPESGVAVINVGGVAFQPFLELFAPDKLPYRCAVISDGDPLTKPQPEDLEGGRRALSPLAEALLERSSDSVHIYLSRRTLEWDLALAGNWEVMLRALEPLKPRVATSLRVELATLGDEERADRLLTAIHDVKGRFAQELATLLDADESLTFLVPGYITDALEWITQATS